MSNPPKTANIVHSFRTLKGNSLISVIFEPLWGIPFALYSFYLSLYMKALGINDTQLGYLISAGFIANIFFSMAGGAITDRLGRRKTTLIFDFLAWPVAISIYLVSGNFLMFALAQIINSMAKITAISWNLMVVEDAGPGEQVAAYNLLNAINISVGIFTPLAGLFINRLGIISGERILLAFAALSMSAMILLRHHYYRETRTGLEILNERKNHLNREAANGWKWNLRLFQTIKQKPLLLKMLVLSILFNAYLPIGTYLSLYYAPFLTEVLQLDKSAIAILGGVNAGVMLGVLIFVTPRLGYQNRFFCIGGGLIIQILALTMFIWIPPANFLLAILCVILFAVGFGVTKPFTDSVLAEVSAGKERAGIYTIHQTGIALLSVGLGFISGHLYSVNPALIYIISIGILLGCIGFLIMMMTQDRHQSDQPAKMPVSSS